MFAIPFVSINQAPTDPGVHWLVGVTMPGSLPARIRGRVAMLGTTRLMCSCDQTPRKLSATVRLRHPGGGAMVSNPVLYAHRRSEEGSCDSICRTCVAIVRSKAEAELEEFEKVHVCDPSLLTEHIRFS